MARQLEVTVDKWPIGPQNRVRSKGFRFSIDETAAHILVGMGKARYVDGGEAIAQAPSAGGAHRPSNGRRRYNRRDMLAID